MWDAGGPPGPAQEAKSRDRSKSSSEEVFDTRNTKLEVLDTVPARRRSDLRTGPTPKRQCHSMLRLAAELHVAM
jgi:hypothetical protein